MAKLMTLQFAVMDNDGNLFGLPAQMYVSWEAAQQVVDRISSTRTNLEQSAKTAAFRLSTATNDMRVAERESLQDDIRRWEAEKDRTFSVVKRRVTPWETVA